MKRIVTLVVAGVLGVAGVARADVNGDYVNLQFNGAAPGVATVTPVLNGTPDPTCYVGPYNVTLSAPTSATPAAPSSTYVTTNVFCDDLTQDISNGSYQNEKLLNFQDGNVGLVVSSSMTTAYGSLAVAQSAAQKEVLQLVQLYVSAPNSIINPSVSIDSTALNLAIWKVLEDPTSEGVNFYDLTKGVFTIQYLSETDGISGSDTDAIMQADAWLKMIYDNSSLAQYSDNIYSAVDGTTQAQMIVFAANLDTPVTPEPRGFVGLASLGLFGLGLATFGGIRRPRQARPRQAH